MPESSLLEQGIAELIAYHESPELFDTLEHLTAARLFFLKGVGELLPADTAARVATHLARSHPGLDSKLASWIQRVIASCREKGILATFRDCENVLSEGYAPRLHELRATDAARRGEQAIGDPIDAWHAQIGLLIVELPRSARKKYVAFVESLPDAQTVVTQPLADLLRQIDETRNLLRHLKRAPAPLSLHARFSLGELLTIAGQREPASRYLDEAIAEYDALLRGAPSETWPWFLARARASLGRALAFKASHHADRAAAESAILALGPALFVFPIPGEHWGAAALSIADAYLSLGRLDNNVHLMVAAVHAYMHAKEDGDLIRDPLIQRMALVGLAEARTAESWHLRDTRALADLIVVCHEAREAIPLEPGLVIYRIRADAALIRCYSGLFELTNDLAWLEPLPDVFLEIEQSWQHASLSGAFVLLQTAAWALQLGIRAGSEFLVEQAVRIFEHLLAQSKPKPGKRDWYYLSSDLASAWLKLGEMRRDRGLVLKALGHFEQVVAAAVDDTSVHMRARFGRANALLVLSQLEHDRAGLLSARDAFAAVLRLVNRQLDYKLYLSAGSSLAYVEMKLEEWQSAERLIRELLSFALTFVLSAHSPLAELEATTTISGLDDMLAFALLEQGRFDEALEASQMGRALTLDRLEAFENLGPEARDGLRRAMHDWRSARDRARKAAVNNVLDFRQHDVEVGDKFTQLQNLIARLTPAKSAAGPADAAMALPPGGVAVAAVVTESGGALILLAHGAATIEAKDIVWLDSLTWTAIRSLVFARNLEEAASTESRAWSVAYNRFAQQTQGAHGYVDAAWTEWDGAIQRMASAVWDLLMGPLDAALRARGVASGTEILLVIPALLSPLPLHAARTQTPVGWRYFIDDWALTTAPSLSAYRLSCRRRKQRGQTAPSLLQVVDPRGDFGIRAIPVVPGFTSRTSLNGSEATVERVLQEMPLHSHLLFYCHGWWDGWKPQDAALLLAGGGRLTVRQLRDAAANAGRAAVLAACETALNGLDTAPDEFTGLPAALLEAGIPGVAASLWPVASGPTLLLCDRLLRNLSTPEVSMAAAVRDAQLWLRDTQGYQELYFWAAFTATGV